MTYKPKDENIQKLKKYLKDARSDKQLVRKQFDRLGK
jgi:hypothetical protein